jgi:hypothetical protein
VLKLNSIIKNTLNMKKGILLGAVAILSTAAFGQTVKKVVCEEKTGTWCGYCPYGTVAFDDMSTSEPDFIGIAIHNGDPMANSYYDGASDALPDFGGYPYAAADRAVGDHAAYTQDSFDARIGMTPAASVNVGANYNASDDKIYITVSATFDSDETGDWRLAAVVVEDDVTGTSAGYAQTNYFSDAVYPTGPSGLVGAGHNWDTETSPVPAASMVYNHVARKCANDEYTGDAGSLPTTLTTGSTYYYDYVVDKQSAWDETQLKVVGMLVEPDGTINNAWEVDVTAAVNSIEEQEASFELGVYPNPATTVANVKVSTIEEANVIVEVTNMLGAVVYTETTQNLPAGEYFYNINVDDFAAGIYNVKTTVNDIVKTAKLSVK